MAFTPTPVDKTKIHGPDVSFYQDQNETPQGIDFFKMKDAGAKFVIIRAGQNLWADPDFRTNWTNAKRAELPRGAYWYLDVRASIRSQARIFADLLRGDIGEIAPVVDFEQWAGKKEPQLNISHLEGFITYLAEYLITPTPIIYTGPAFWKQFGNKDIKWLKHKLWIANYKTDAPTIPLPWSKATLWQFADTCDGKEYGVESNAIDMNYFMGTEAEFDAFVNYPVQPFPIPPANPNPTYTAVITVKSKDPDFTIEVK